LQTTALVNEAYLQFVDKTHPRWQNRPHFFAVAAQLMRRIMVDHARQRHALKRGGAAQKVTLDEAALVTRRDRRNCSRWMKRWKISPPSIRG
jgi:ECF sigma factor.